MNFLTLLKNQRKNQGFVKKNGLKILVSGTTIMQR